MSITIQIRLPAGRPIKAEFEKNQSLEDVQFYVLKNSNLEKDSFSFITQYPKKEYECVEFKSTKLGSIDAIQPRGVLTIIKNSQKGKMVKGEGVSLGKILHADSITEFEKMLKMYPNSLFVVDYFAPWCPPCRMIAPYFEKLSEKYRRVVFVKVDGDKAKQLTARENVKAYPTFHFWKNGKRIQELDCVGGNPTVLGQKVEEAVKKYE